MSKKKPYKEYDRENQEIKISTEKSCTFYTYLIFAEID